MSYTAWSVVYGEQPTAAKWNQLGANDAGFKDGTNIDASAIITAKIADEAVTAAKIANRTRRALFLIAADGSATSVNSKTEGSPEVSLTGTNTDYARGSICVPQDYLSGTNATIILHIRTTNNQSLTGQHFIGARAPAGSFTSWNVASAVTNGSNAYTTAMRELTLPTTINSSNLAAGGTVLFAFGNMGAITGTLFVVAAELQYTADS